MKSEAEILKESKKRLNDKSVRFSMKEVDLAMAIAAVYKKVSSEDILSKLIEWRAL